MTSRARSQPARFAFSLCALAIVAAAPAAAPGAGDTAPESRPKPAAVLPTPVPMSALDRMPENATAYCGDGTWAIAVAKPDACIGRGGVKAWFGPAPPGTTGRCKDGTYTRAKKGTYGACSGYGGVKVWLSRPVPAVATRD